MPDIRDIPEPLRTQIEEAYAAVDPNGPTALDRLRAAGAADGLMVNAWLDIQDALEDGEKQVDA